MATQKPDLTRVWANGAPPGNVVDPDTTAPGKVNSGWQAEVPPFEHFNFLQKWFTQGLAHFNEQGIAVWDTNTTYPIGGLVKGSDTNLYVSLSEQSGNDPVSDAGVNWKLAFLNDTKADLRYTPTYKSTSDMISNTLGVSYADGMPLKVQGEFNVFTNYVVTTTVTPIDLGGGLYAKQVNINEDFKDWSETATNTTVQAVVDRLNDSGQARILGDPTYTDLVLWKGRRHLTDNLPFRVNSVSTPGGGLNARMTVSGGILYVCGFAQNRIEMFSLADPRNPRYIGNFATGLSPRHVEVIGKIVIVCCLASAEIRFYDVSQIDNVIQIGTIPTDVAPKMFELSGNDMYVVCNVNRRLQKFTFYLPNDEKNTTIEGKFEFSYRKISDVETCVEPLCCSLSNNGVLAVTGASTELYLHGAQNLAVIGTQNIGTGDHGICQFVRDSHVLLTDWGSSQLHSVDVTDPSVPALVNSISVVSNPEQIQIVGDRCYIPQLDVGTTHLSAVDLVDVQNMHEFKQVELTVGQAGFTAYYQVGENGYVYVNGHSTPFNIDVIEVVAGEPSVHKKHAQDNLGVRELAATSAKIGIADMRQSYETFTTNFTVTDAMNVIRAGFSSGSLTATLPDPSLSPNKQFTLCNVGDVGFTLNVSNAFNGFGGTVNHRGSITLLSTVFGGIWQWDVIGGGEYTP